MNRPDPDLPLLQRMARGDADALEALYDRYTPLLFPVALRIVRTPADAEDVLQQAWVKAWSSADEFDPGRGNAAGWLLSIVRSRALDLGRARAARRRAEGEAEPLNRATASEPAATAAERQTRERVKLALQRLDPHYRQVLESAYFDGLTQSEIAERLEAPLGTVKTWTRRGLLRLRELLPPELLA